MDNAHSYPSVGHMVSAEQVPALRQTATVLEQALIPAAPDRIEVMVGKLSIAFPKQRISDDEADVRLEQYREGLSDIPIDILTEAYRRAIKTRTYFPTVAEIRALCPELHMRRYRLSRINALLMTYERGTTLARAGKGEHDATHPPPLREQRAGPVGDAARRVMRGVTKR